MLRQQINQSVAMCGHLRWQLPVLISVAGLTYVAVGQFLLVRYGLVWQHTLLGVLLLSVLAPILVWRMLTQAEFDSSKRYQADLELQTAEKQCYAMNAIAQAVSRSLNFDDTLDLILGKVLELMKLDVGIVSLVDGDRLVQRVYRGVSSDAITSCCEVRLRECLCGTAAAGGGLMVVNDLKKMEYDGLFPWCRANGYRAVFSLPVKSKNQTVAVLHLASHTPRDITPYEWRSLTSIGHQIGVAIERAHIYSEINGLNERLQQRVQAQTRRLDAARTEITDKARRLQQLLTETISVQEKERTRIAYDMHDRAAQLIVGALYQIQAGRECVTRESEADPNLRNAQTLLKELETEIRSTIHDLQPLHPNGLGLVPALRNYTDRFFEASDLHWTVTVLGRESRLQHDAEVAVYRIVQEALRNVVRHADAARVDVTLDFRGTNMLVSVNDDGCGFDTEGAHRQNPQHLGIISMRERALSVGSELQIRSHRERGTAVVLSVSIPEQQLSSQMTSAE